MVFSDISILSRCWLGVIRVALKLGLDLLKLVYSQLCLVFDLSSDDVVDVRNQCCLIHTDVLNCYRPHQGTLWLGNKLSRGRCCCSCRSSNLLIHSRCRRGLTRLLLLILRRGGTRSFRG